MSTKQLLRQILQRLSRFKILLLIGALLFAALLYMYAKSKPVTYSMRGSVFPSNAAPENSASSKVNELLGGGGSKSISEDANVNIEEVARSKKTRDAVVAERLPAYGNKTIAEVLVAEYNKRRGFFASKLDVPSSEMIATGSELLLGSSNVKFNKNALLEVYFSSTDRNLLVPVGNILIEKISQFYKELKIEKAKFDYDFIQAKVDSFDAVLQSYDSRRIRMSNTTMFVPKDRLQYAIPRENLEGDKMRVTAQRNSASINREEALWRLQKVTPIIKVLDQPGPPFSPSAPSAMLYGIGGFVLGLLFFAFILVAGILYRYVNWQIETALTEKKPDNTSTTA